MNIFFEEFFLNVFSPSFLDFERKYSEIIFIQINRNSKVIEIQYTYTKYSLQLGGI